MSGVSGADLARHAFTQDLTAGDRDHLAALARATQFPAGQRIFAEGEPANRLWLITAGRVALDLYAPGRDRLLIETLGPGTELGLSWLAPVPQWQFGAVAQLTATTFEFESAAVMALCEANTDLGYQLTRRLLTTAISRLQAARIRILDLYAPPAGGP
jgi:CRP/FNR family transcriptional regulator, cyclic AMP receptor protein